MPLRGRQSLKDQKVFFVTTTLKDHINLFNTCDKLNTLREIIKFCINKYNVVLYGYVLMTNHFHLLVRLEGGGPQLSSLMREVKTYTRKKLFPDSKVIWMPRFDDVAIYSDEQFRIKLDYIHNNPVKAGLVLTPEEYEFSSARNWLSGFEDELVSIDF